MQAVHAIHALQCPLHTIHALQCPLPAQRSCSPCRWRQVIDTYSYFTDYFLDVASKLLLPIVDVIGPNSSSYLSTPFAMVLYHSSH